MLPIENESFYNIAGDEISRESIVEKMIDYYSEKLEIGETRVTDFNEGSEIRNLLESIAVDLYDLMQEANENSKVAFISSAYGEWLDLHGENPLIDSPRDTGTEATGLVTFSIPEATTVDVIIPEDTILVCEDNDLEYATDSEAIIVPGDTSVDVYCTCLTVGEDGNCSANAITVIDDDNIDETVTVTNPEAFSEGTDYEEDDEYQTRLLNIVRKDNFGSVGYYKELGESVDGVHDILLVDDENYTRKILVNTSYGADIDEVLMNVLLEFTKLENIVLDHSFIVDTPKYVRIGLHLDLSLEYEVDDLDITNALALFYEGGVSDDGYEYEGFSIGETFNESMFYTAIENIDGVLRAEAYAYYVLTETTYGETPSPSDRLNLKLSDIPIPSDAVIRGGDLELNKTVVGE